MLQALKDLIATTVSPTVVEGGATRPQSLPGAGDDQCACIARDAEQFIERARMIVSAFPGVTLEWEEGGAAVPMSSDKSAAFRLVATLANKSAGNVTVAPCLYIGSTDARHYRRGAGSLPPRPRSGTMMTCAALWAEGISRDNLARMIGFYKSIIVEAAG